MSGPVLGARSVPRPSCLCHLLPGTPSPDRGLDNRPWETAHTGWPSRSNANVAMSNGRFSHVIRGHLGEVSGGAPKEPQG